jgi:hypothetical protein
MDDLDDFGFGFGTQIRKSPYFEATVTRNKIFGTSLMMLFYVMFL